MFDKTKEGKTSRNWLIIIPAILTIWEEVKRFFRKHSHDRSTKNLDITNEQLGTMENMLVRLEKHIQLNREHIDNVRFQLMLITLMNLLLVLAIFLKLFILS